ncbi:adrenodoxin-like [Alosa sapidissima]|uniref:adrenodoxin-like n=1 Tax=Alosa sapidissima TaxID=34773 RepID=UPI001C09445E|nr:adrenodoxin-like [Alosa sapidissima]
MSSASTRVLSFAQNFWPLWLASTLPATTRNVPSLVRPLHKLNTSSRSLTTVCSLRSEQKINITFVYRDGERVEVQGRDGDTLLNVVVDHKLNIEGFGACEGTLACSTCHVILDESNYNKLGIVSDEEMDLLDLAFGLTETSRLGCQICLSNHLHGMVVRVPDSVNDIRQTDGAGPSS